MNTQDLFYCKKASRYFLYYLSQLKPDAAKWIRYEDAEIFDGSIQLVFSSSQNGLKFSFSVDKGTEDDLSSLQVSHSDVASFFRRLKYEFLNVKTLK